MALLKSADERRMEAVRKQREEDRRQAAEERAKEQAAHASALRFKLDLAKLSVDECREIGALDDKARNATPPFRREDFNGLSTKDRKRLFALVEKGLRDSERERLRAVEEQRIRRLAENAATRAASEGLEPPAHTFVLPESAVGGGLDLGDLGVLCVVRHAFATGMVLFVGGRWSQDGEALLLPKRLRLTEPRMNTTYNTEGMGSRLVGLEDSLAHLDATGHLSAKRQADGWTIRLR